MKTKISIQWPSLLVFYSFLRYYTEKEVKWEALMWLRCLPVAREEDGRHFDDQCKRFVSDTNPQRNVRLYCCEYIHSESHETYSALDTFTLVSDTDHSLL